jgi:hypothetical protein
MAHLHPTAVATYKYVDFLIKESEKVQKFLEISSVSQPGEIDSFIKYITYKENEPMCELDQKHKEFLNDESNNIPHFLRIMFEFLGNPDLRILCGKFTFYTLNEIIDNFNKIPNIIDIGNQYAGMGHFTALTINRLNKKLFFRREGGSNGYDQGGNYNYYKKYCAEDINRFKSHFKTMDQIIKIISEKKVDFFDPNMVYMPDEKDLGTIIQDIF